METVALPETPLEHGVELATETKFNVCAALTPFIVTLTVPPAPIVAVVVDPPLILQVTTSVAVPVSVNTAFWPEQTDEDTAATEAVKAAGFDIVIALVCSEQKLPSVTKSW